ncbi:prepilin-type N-terminal cleavage/methylation domain-containing protein [bacterium]|nr:prepilin-type N-terminal cleavage/methylation domain-containing protein [bacterium]
MKKFKKAFTLAEVLITLGVIGVVAAITMPTVIANINERVNSERHANIAMKVTQAMEQMRAHGLLNNTYPSTESFVDELQKYLKIAKRCDSSHIAECWPTEKVIDSNGDEFEISKAKTGKNLSLTTETNNVGLVLADGASMILNYNPSETFTLDVGDGVTAYKKSLPIGGGKEKEFAYSTNVTESIDFITDVNGGKGPNKEKSDKYYDIRNLRGATFSKGCTGIEIPGIGCVVNLGSDYNRVGSKSYFESAMIACENIDMVLADIDTLRAIYNKKSEYPEIPKINWYFSSSSGRNDYIWCLLFNSGEEGEKSKSTKHGVICTAK